jgi:hypothetical protein
LSRRSREERNLLNIDIKKRIPDVQGGSPIISMRLAGREFSKSPTRMVNEVPLSTDVAPFDNSPEVQDKRKWKEVMEFMEANPQIMMDVLPPTPGKKYRQPNLS